MKFTLNWLKDHLVTKASLTEIVDAMIMAGLEVEHVDDPAAKLKAFSVAKVKDAKPHPDADRLRLCTVDTVDGEKQIVCGAPNARKGMTAIYAPLGTYIPGLDFTLDKKPRKIRGVESHGMLCSTKELDAGDDADGIADLPDSFTVGTPAAEALGVDDPVIEFEVTPNRPDWLGVKGIARDLAAAGLGRFKPQVPDTISGAYPCPVEIGVETPNCPVFGGVLIRGVHNKPSPDWMQARLRAVGITPKNMLVDVTNFVSIDRARPLHAYDASKLRGKIHARDAKDGESFEALDGKTYTLSEGMCVICDDSGVIGLGGIMGGTSTAVSEQTISVFIESAWFDPLNIARSGRATGIISDARYRFERGVDPESVMDGLAMAVELITGHCGGEVSEPHIAGAAPPREDRVLFNPNDVERLTGLKVKTPDLRRILKDLGFDAEDTGEAFYLTVPSWRFDVAQSADLVEEVARLIGYDNLPTAKLPPIAGAAAKITTPIQERVRTARRVMAARGYNEAVTWSFMRRDWAEMFGGGEPELVVANPVSSDLDCMRPTALANLAIAAQRNSDRGVTDVRLFEAGPVYLGDGPKDQRRFISGLIQPATQRHWSGKTTADVYTVKADLFAVLNALDQPADRFQLTPVQSSHWHPGQSAYVKLGPKTTVAAFGALHPRVLKALDVDGPVYAFEINLHALPQMKAKLTKTKPVLDLPDQTPIRRDFAFLVDAGVEAAEIVRHAASADKNLITSVSVFDVYTGTGTPEGKKSVAFEVVIQPRGEALKDTEIDAISKAIIAAVAKGTGGVLRG